MLELRHEVLGAKRPDTVSATPSIASTWSQQGRSDEAETLEAEVLELRQEVLGAKHLDTVMAMANLAATWSQQGRYDEAETLHTEVLELRKEVLGAKHYDRIAAIANFAEMTDQFPYINPNLGKENAFSIPSENEYSALGTTLKRPHNRPRRWTKKLRWLGNNSLCVAILILSSLPEHIREGAGSWISFALSFSSEGKQ